MLVTIHLAFAVLTWCLAGLASLDSELARQKFGLIVVGWFSIIAAGVIAYSGYWFPRTLIGAYYYDALRQSLGPIALGPIIYWSTLAACLFVTAKGSLTLLKRATVRGRRASLALLALLGTSGLAVAAWPYSLHAVMGGNAQSQPNVIILGIDSLRLEQLSRFGGRGNTPNLDRFLDGADVMIDTTTPAARTFSSWTAILTGRAPTVTGARFNLAERSSVQANPTFADTLRDAGYRTVYSTDEVRFANIDESYGFDQVITPRIGASDFLVGTYNDLPLPSVLINTRLGKWLFPFSHANRGVATMFQSESFVDRVRRELTFDGPTLFISHLTAAHWPYYTSDVPFKLPEATPENPKPAYRIGLQTADRMFGEMIELLKQKGAIRNAIVIVLSDHGEALRLPTDSFFDSTFRVNGLQAPLKMLDYGHGQSVLSRSQYQVLLSFTAFGNQAAFSSAGRSFDYPATVEDIAPTILEAVGVVGDPLSATGRSLLPILTSSGTLAGTEELRRIRFTETDLSVLPAPGGGVDEVATAKQNSKFFEVDHSTGRLHIRPELASLAIAFKERAAFTKTNLLAAVPAGPYAHQYLYFDFQQHHGQLLLTRPVDDELPEAQRLWDALAQNYGEELKPPAVVTPSDWVRIEREWSSFPSHGSDGNLAGQSAAK